MTKNKEKKNNTEERIAIVSLILFGMGVVFDSIPTAIAGAAILVSLFIANATEEITNALTAKDEVMEEGEG